MANGVSDSIAEPGRDRSRAAPNPRRSLLRTLAQPAGQPATVRTLWAIYALEVLLVAALRIPHDLGFFAFAFGDRGSWLVVQLLTAHGFRPTIDFGFPYGLMPVMVGGVWFRLFGLTPAAFKLAMVAGGIAMAFGMARFANAMRLGRIGQALMIIAIPMAIQSSLPSLSHLLEAVMLCLALGEHSRGNRRAALALTTAACFAKPALGYLYGFLLLVMIVARCRRNAPPAPSQIDWRALVRAIMPAAVTGVVMLAALGFVYGVRPLVASLLPLNGMRIYATNHFGFFTPWSRTFWCPAPGAIGAYVGTIAPFWMGSTIWLALAATFAGWRLLSAPVAAAPTRARDELIFCCGLLQTLFVLRFFGPPMSWTYYPYLLLLGVAATSTLSFGPAMVALALAAVALVPQLAYLASGALQWKSMAPSPVTAQLWADSNERAEWATVERLIAGHRAVAVGVAGGVPLLAPNFAPPLGAYLVPDESTPAEVERTIARVNAAEFVVRPASVSIGDPATDWPALTRAFDHLEVVWKGRVYQVDRHRPSP